MSDPIQEPTPEPTPQPEGQFVLSVAAVLTARHHLHRSYSRRISFTTLPCTSVRRKSRPA